MCRKRAPILRRGVVREVVPEVIVLLRILTRSRVILRREQVYWCPALPPADQPCPEQLTTLIRGEAGNWVVLEERVELGHKLEEVAQCDEATIECPRRSGDWLLRPRIHIVVTSAEDNALSNGLLAGVRVRVEVLDSGLRDTVEETKAESIPRVILQDESTSSLFTHCSWPCSSLGRT